MTTDLTDDFGLGEEEFAWDVFEPDPDDADIAAEAAALEDGDELDLDDSEFDWDAALREDPEPEAGADGGARAGAAYDRIVDTVRRSFEDAEPRAAIEPEPFAVHTAETPPATESGPEVEHFAFAPEAEAELRQGLWLPETELWLEADPELEEEPGWDLEPELEPAEARIAEMAATVASLEAAESSPVAPEAEAAGSEEALPHDDAGEAASTESPIPPTRTSRTKKRHEQNRRSRVFTTTVVLACLVLVVVATVAIVDARHHPTTATTGRTPAHAVSPTSSTTDAARIQTATDALDSATTSATVGISSLATFPTPSNVEKVINPYMSSLQLFGTLLSGSTVPAAARPAASSAEAQVRQDLQFLDTIEALPPLQLGSFLKQFDADATQLQTTLSALEQNLRAATS